MSGQSLLLVDKVPLQTKSFSMAGLLDSVSFGGNTQQQQQLSTAAQMAGNSFAANAQQQAYAQQQQQQQQQAHYGGGGGGGIGALSLGIGGVSIGHGHSQRHAYQPSSSFSSAAAGSSFMHHLHSGVQANLAQVGSGGSINGPPRRSFNSQQQQVQMQQQATAASSSPPHYFHAASSSPPGPNASAMQLLHMQLGTFGSTAAAVGQFRPQGKRK